MLMNAFRVVAVLLVLATGILPTLQSETVKTVQFSYQNEIFVTNHIYRHKNQIGRNETIRLTKPLFYYGRRSAIWSSGYNLPQQTSGAKVPRTFGTKKRPDMDSFNKLDSEIYWPYGFFYKLNQSKPLEETNIPNATILKSKKLAASLISNCNALSGRDYVLNSLKKYMEIDSYGKCG
ncbi:unnamed protein product, partial [Allacma fusca]